MTVDMGKLTVRRGSGIRTALTGLAVALPIVAFHQDVSGREASQRNGFSSLIATLHDPTAVASNEFGSSVGASGGTIVVGTPGYKSETGAAYVYEIGRSGWPSKPTVTLNDPEHTTDDYFGYSVAISSSTIVVGAFGTNFAFGNVYVYVKGTAGWPSSPTLTLTDPNTQVDEDFGFDVAISGKTILIGGDAGTAAYFYVKGTSGWPSSPTTTVLDPVKTSDSGFGSSIALSGNAAVVGGDGVNAYLYSNSSSGWETTPAVKLGDPDNNSLHTFGNSLAVFRSTVLVGKSAGDDLAGTTYLYSRGTSGWPNSPTAILVDPAAAQEDQFGIAVGLSGAQALVGTDNLGSSPNVVYLYKKSSSSWPTSPSGTISDPKADNGDGFGHAVLVSGDEAVITSPYT